MADGQVLIDSKINTAGVTKGAAEIKKAMEQTAQQVNKAADTIEKGFEDVNYKKAFEKLPKEFQSAYTKIEMIRANDLTDNEAKAKQIAAVYEALGDDQVSAQKKAWAIIEAETTDGSHKVIDDLQAISSEAEKTGEKVKDIPLADLFKTQITATFAVDFLREMGRTAVEVGKQAVQVAADINASNAQFEQTFKGIEKTARDSLNKISKEVGITATRMQNSYTKIFAFTKSVGADQEQALDISSRALRAAADSAAYYDVSMEEATETLQSFLKGNYENDAALGIAATETTRNAKANELYAKSFQELSEAQKVDVLLAMVEAGNEASGALGQAAREADSWTNVLGELQEAWRLLLGVMGDPLLEGLIPVIQGITGVLQELSNTAASVELFDNLGDYKETLSGLDEEFNATSEAIEKNAAMAELYKERLLELEREGFDKNSAAAREYANAVDALNAIYPELNLKIDEATGKLTANSKAMLSNLDAMKKKAVYAAYEEKYTAALKAQADAIVAVQTAEKELQAVQTERNALEQQLMEMTGKSAQDLAYLYGNMSLAVHDLTSEEFALYNQIVQLIKEEKNLTNGVEEGNEAISQQDTALEELQGEMENAGNAAGVLTDAENEVAAATETAAESQEDLAKRFQDAKASAMDALNSTVGLFSELKFESKATTEEVIANWQTQQEAFTNYAQNLQKAIDMGLDEALVQQLADGSTQSMEYLQLLVTDSNVKVEEINAAFQNLSGAKDTAATAMAGIKENIAVELEGVGESVNTALTTVGEGAAAAMSEAATQITINFTTPVQEDVQNLGGVIEETFSNAAETMQESWGDKAQWFQSNVESPIKTSTESIGSTMLSTLSSMESETAAAWNRMVQDVQNAINRMQSSINSLTGKTVNVTVNKTGSGASAINSTGYDGLAYTPDAVSAVPAGIPMLATGAVIPPNAPFFAMLGDQTNGRNLEAPEKLIRQIIQEEVGEIVVRNEINFVGELAALARILYPEIQSEAQRIGPSLAEEVRT